MDAVVRTNKSPDGIDGNGLFGAGLLASAIFENLHYP